MVIFKYIISWIIIPSLFRFTFQSGDIQINRTCPGKKWAKYKFTFQSGDIQIIHLLQADIQPIKFTFQSGDIQI